MKPLTFIRWVAVLTVFLAACHAPTGPSSLTILNPSADDVQARRAMWVAHAPTGYSYVLTESGGFNAFAGRPFQLVVRNDTVEGVTFFDTHQLVPGPYTFWPTMDGLFDEAVSAAGGGQLTAISFDPLLSYPTRMNFIPRPDVTSSIEATDLSSATPR